MTTNAAPNEGERHKFPKKHLVTGERILWEGRPSIVVYFLRSLLLFVFGGLFGVMAILQSNQDVDLANLGTFLALLAMLLLVVLMVGVHRKWGLLSGLISVAIIVLVVLNVHVNGLVYFIPMIIGLLAFAIEYLIWSHTYFAISDRRIMTQYGIFNIMFADTQIDRVQNVTVVQPLIERILGYGDVMFATAGEMGGIQSSDPREMMKSGGAIVWDNIPKPFQVRKVAEEIIFSANRRQTVQYVTATAPTFVAPQVVSQPAPAYAPSQPAAQPAQTYATSAPAVQPAASTAAPPQPSIPTAEAEERMIKLKEMRDKNLISEEEYQQKRKEILGRF
jgi:membrane protein YdbS with pleckstrin-like domain